VNGIHEVSGSIPLGSTKSIAENQDHSEDERHAGSGRSSIMSSLGSSSEAFRFDLVFGGNMRVLRGLAVSLHSSTCL